MISPNKDPDAGEVGAWVSLVEVRGTTDSVAAVVWVVARALTQEQFDSFVVESMRREGFAVLQHLEVFEARALTRHLPFDVPEVLVELAKEPIGMVFLDQFHYFPLENS